jgi:ribonuclease T2
MRVLLLVIGIFLSLTAHAFDDYVLAVTLTPAFCDNNTQWKNSVQCRERKPFNVHGLWPQSRYRSEAEYCQGGGLQLSIQQEKDLKRAIADKGQWDYQWKKHGRCSGLTSADYFSFLSKEFADIKWPDVLQPKGKDAIVQRSRIIRDFVQINPGFSEQGIVLRCEGRDRPALLQELRLCLTKEGVPKGCSTTRGNCPVIVKVRAQ